VRNPKGSDPFSELYGEFRDRLQGDHWQPDVDVFETDTDVVVRVELAGVRQEDVRVSVDGDQLRISGHRATGESEAISLHQMEIAAGPFDRRLRIPVAFDRDHVSARLSEGILTIRLARRVERQRRVEIE
jgi:HSP20 family protein